MDNAPDLRTALRTSTPGAPRGGPGPLPPAPWWANPELWRKGALGLGLILLASSVVLPRTAIPLFALGCGLLFFLYGIKYYASVAIIMLTTSGTPDGEENGNGLQWPFSGLGNGNGHNNGNGLLGRLQRAKQRQENGWVNGGHDADFRIKPEHQPFISIQLPMYNEDRVVDRLLEACTQLDYQNFEVLVADDSSDRTLGRLEHWAKHPKVRVSHRINRSGFKGAALKHATEIMNPTAEFVAIFDADFIPPPDILHQFLSYFYGINGPNGNGNGNGNGHEPPQLVDDSLAVVQGYQWHVLNASENWITKGIRTEFAGSYVVERSSQELTGGMKMISGSVFMIRADVLRTHEWGTSITEDWELTLRLYLQGYKVLYTPFIQAPAECVSDFKQLSRQRMRWAEGHTYNVKRFFFEVLLSPRISRREKLEFIYYAPYYLTSVLFMLGTLAWIVSELFLKVRLPFWTDLLGWSLVFTNALALILMNLAGLFQERGIQRSWAGLFSFVLLTFLLVPYQAYASLKGLLEPKEGGWHRTLKSGAVTDVIRRMGMGRRMPRLLPKKKQSPSIDLAKRLGPSAARMAQILPVPLVGALRVIGQRIGPVAGVGLGLLLVAMQLSAFRGFQIGSDTSDHLLYFQNAADLGGFALASAIPSGAARMETESVTLLTEPSSELRTIASGNTAIHLWLNTEADQGVQLLQVHLEAGSDERDWRRLGGTTWPVETDGVPELLSADFFTEEHELLPGDRLRLQIALPESEAIALMWDGEFSATRLEIPTDTMPAWTLTLLPAAPLVVYAASWVRRRRRTALRVLSLFLAICVALGFLAFHVPSAGAMPSYDVGTGTTFWLYDDTTPLTYMMFQTQPSGTSTNATNTTVNFYSDTWPNGWQLNAGTSTAYLNIQTNGLKTIDVTLQAGSGASWTTLGSASQNFNQSTIALVSISFSTNAYTFSTGERLRLQVGIQNSAWVYWDGSYNTSRLETPAIVVPDLGLALIPLGLLLPTLVARLRHRQKQVVSAAVRNDSGENL